MKNFCITTVTLIILFLFISDKPSNVAYIVGIVPVITTSKTKEGKVPNDLKGADGIGYKYSGSSCTITVHVSGNNILPVLTKVAKATGEIQSTTWYYEPTPTVTAVNK